MDQEQEDRRPSDDGPDKKKQRLNRQRLTLQNPNDMMNGIPDNQVNQRMVDFEQQQQAVDEQQQAGRKRRRSKKLRHKSRRTRKSRKSRKSRRYRR